MQRVSRVRGSVPGGVLVTVVLLVALGLVGVGSAALWPYLQSASARPGGEAPAPGVADSDSIPVKRSAAELDLPTPPAAEEIRGQEYPDGRITLSYRLPLGRAEGVLEYYRKQMPRRNWSLNDSGPIRLVGPDGSRLSVRGAAQRWLHWGRRMVLTLSAYDGPRAGEPCQVTLSGNPLPE